MADQLENCEICPVPLRDVLKRCSLQVGGGGGIGATVSEALSKQTYLDSAGDAAPCCDPLFRRTLTALVLERYSTVFLRFVSSTPTVAGGNLIYTPPTANEAQLEFYKHGINASNVSNPLATSVEAGTTALPLAGENCPFPLTFVDTNATQEIGTPASTNADLVMDENMDFVAVGMACEIEDVFSVDETTSGTAYRRRVDAVWYQGDASYEERLKKEVLVNSHIRFFVRIGSEDRTWRMGAPNDWPSYGGYFGNKALTAGQPLTNTFKEFTSAVRTRMKPKLTSQERLRIFLDVPAPIDVPNNAANTVPLGLSPSVGVATGAVWVALKLKLFGITVCDSEVDGPSPADRKIAELQSQVAAMAAMVANVAAGRR